jgi:hypothetical protein
LLGGELVLLSEGSVVLLDGELVLLSEGAVGLELEDDVEGFS